MISCYLAVLNQSLAQYLSFYGTEFNNSKVGQVGTEYMFTVHHVVQVKVGLPRLQWNGLQQRTLMQRRCS